MDNIHGWPASAVVTASVLAIAAVGGWFETSVQVHARSANAHAAEELRTGLQARAAALEEDLSHANAQAQAFALQAKTARADAATAEQRSMTLAGQLADAKSHEAKSHEAKSHEDSVLAAADLRIDALKSARADRRLVAVHAQPQGASNITPTSVRSDVAPELPLPDLPRGATGRDYLVAAQQSIRAGSLGKAQACLERAEVRFLNVTSRAGPRRTHRQEVAGVERALDQLGADDRQGALKTVDHLLSAARA